MSLFHTGVGKHLKLEEFEQTQQQASMQVREGLHHYLNRINLSITSSKRYTYVLLFTGANLLERDMGTGPPNLHTLLLISGIPVHVQKPVVITTCMRPKIFFREWLKILSL